MFELLYKVFFNLPLRRGTYAVIVPVPMFIIVITYETDPWRSGGRAEKYLVTVSIRRYCASARTFPLICSSMFSVEQAMCGGKSTEQVTQ